MVNRWVILYTYKYTNDPSTFDQMGGMVYSSQGDALLAAERELFSYSVGRNDCLLTRTAVYDLSSVIPVMSFNRVVQKEFHDAPMGR